MADNNVYFQRDYIKQLWEDITYKPKEPKESKDYVLYNEILYKEGYRHLFPVMEYSWKQLMLSNDYIPEKVLFNGPATVAFWKDGTKTVIKCSEEDAYDPEKAVLWAIFEKWICPDGKFSKTSRRRIMEELTKDALNEWPEDGFSEDWVK